MCARVALVCVVLTAWCFAAESLPVTPAETLFGQKLAFPTHSPECQRSAFLASQKQPATRQKIWMTKLDDAGIKAWLVAELESAPTLVRGMIRSSMRRGTPTTMLDRSLVMTKDDKAWRSALDVKQENLPVVVLLDAMGKVLRTYEGVFTEETLVELKGKLDAARR
jgi:hypothetical protein